MIRNIETKKIAPHPNNPRKNLGDLIELAESIKAKGILQNLTVVPLTVELDVVLDYRPYAEYIAVIGNRRLAAAELAGLAEVPCAVSDMSFEEQIATMLLENIQRADLTAWEQAQGFQLMIDLGDTVKGISEKTGFSETTVRKRIKLTELDPEKFKESESRGATLMDYVKLSEIENPKTRNAVLEKIGTSDFNCALKRELDKEENDRRRAALIASLERFAVRKTKGQEGLRYVRNYADAADVVVPEDVGAVKYYCDPSPYGCYVALYADCPVAYEKANKAAEDAAKELKARNERWGALASLAKTAYGLRIEFVRGLSNAKAKKSMGIVMRYALEAVPFGGEISEATLADVTGIEGECIDSSYTDAFCKLYAAKPEYGLLIAVYGMLDLDGNNCFDWRNQYSENECLNAVYAFLGELGYEPSEEERAFVGGTHELFAVANAE
jgi:ParB family chromosome partitioning protein